jgi:hypothetical protein
MSLQGNTIIIVGLYIIVGKKARWGVNKTLNYGIWMEIWIATVQMLIFFHIYDWREVKHIDPNLMNTQSTLSLSIIKPHVNIISNLILF